MPRCAAFLLLPGLLLGVGGAVPAAAQVTPRIDLYTSYTDNIFQNINGRSDWITQADIDLDFSPTSALNLYYSANANVFSETEDLFSHTHSVGLGYQRLGEERGALYAGAQVSLRLDRPLYDFRDYVRGTAFANAKKYVRDDLLLRAGYTLGVEEYVNATAYSFVEQSATVQASRFLPSRTTLLAGAELGLKTYLRDAETASDDAVPARAGNGRNLVQLVARAKAAQSLAQDLGLQAEYVLRANLAGTSRFADTQLYNPDDDLFDDRYAYEGHTLRTALKYLAGRGVLVEAEGRWERRVYPGRPALDLEGFLLDSGASRRDTRQELTLSLSRSFYPDSGLASEVRLHLDGSYLDVGSNDPYYDAASRTYSVGLQFDF